MSRALTSASVVLLSRKRACTGSQLHRCTAIQCSTAACAFHPFSNMDFNAKQAARSKHKHSQHLNRVHGGRGRGRSGPSTHHTLGPDLESNFDRYNLADEEDEQGSGELVRQSEGADLEQLLAESEQFYAQAHFRFRSFTDTINIEPPPVDVAALEQELALQAEPLMQALALLPLSELLGIDPEYIQACDVANDVLGLTDSTAGKHGAAEQQEQQLVAAQLQQHQLVKHLPPQAQQQQQRQQQDSKTIAFQNLPGSSRSAVTPSTSKPPPAAVAPPPVVPAAAQANPSLRSPVLDDDDDDSLQQLLTGSTAQQRIPVASRVQQAAATAVNSSRDNRPGVPEQSAASKPAGPPPVSAAKPMPAAASAAAGGADDDDELDELLGLCGATPQQPSTQAKLATQPAGTSSTKKQSLEDWLDGF